VWWKAFLTCRAPQWSPPCSFLHASTSTPLINISRAFARWHFSAFSSVSFWSSLLRSSPPSSNEEALPFIRRVPAKWPVESSRKFAARERRPGLWQEASNTGWGTCPQRPCPPEGAVPDPGRERCPRRSGGPPDACRARRHADWEAPHPSTLAGTLLFLTSKGDRRKTTREPSLGDSAVRDQRRLLAQR